MGKEEWNQELTKSSSQRRFREFEDAPLAAYWAAFTKKLLITWSDNTLNERYTSATSAIGKIMIPIRKRLSACCEI